MTRRQRLSDAPGQGPTSQGGPEPKTQPRAGESPFLASQRSESGPGWEMRLGDCLEGLRSLADDSVDVVITDPPYDEHVDANFVTMGKHVAGRTRLGRHKQERVFREQIGIGAMNPITIGHTARDLVRVTKRWILVFCAFEQTHLWRWALEGSGARYIRQGAWEKPDSTPQLSGDRPAVWGEAFVLVYASEGAMRWNGGGKRALYRAGVCRGYERSEHPTQKPLDLVIQLVEDFSEPGETILDAFAGSGTTGVAAIQLGRRFLGWELAACARCSSTARWNCSWLDGKERQQRAFLCDAHRDEVSGMPGFAALRDNYFDIACRRLRGEEAKPKIQQPSLLDWRSV